MTNTRPLPSLSRLSELLYYNKETGLFTWKVSRGRVAAGSTAGKYSQRGYRLLGIDGAAYQEHRIAYFMGSGTDPHGSLIDHVNGNRADNRFANLRLCSAEQNQHNSGKRNANTSGYKGVSFDRDRNRWRASITAFGERKFIGRFDTPELAHMAYCKAAAELHGEFARGA